MPRNNLASIFLVSVLVIGLASYPISLQSVVVFADDDDKGPNNDKGPKNDKEKGLKNDKDKGSKNEKDSSDLARTFEDDDDEEDENEIDDDEREDKRFEFVNDNGNGNGKVTICHAPPGNPSNAHTITIGAKAAVSHILRHTGDEMGECVNEGQSSGKSDFEIRGIKYYDENENGTFDDGEQRLTGWEIVLILSSDSSTVDTTITEEKGKYKFKNLSDETYVVKEVLQPGWTQTEPASDSHIVVLTESENKVEGINFGNFFESADTNPLFQTMTKTKDETIHDAEETISKLMKKIEQLEKRIQKLLLKVKSGEYFGNISDGDPVVKSLGISFEGTATSLDDGSDVENISGEIFIETLVTRDNASKFRVMGGEIELGGTEYDLIFGKARISSTGTSGEKDSMVLLAHIVDDNGNDTTVKLLLDFEIPLEGDYGLEPIDFQIKSPQSKISDDWTLSGSGQLTVV